MKSWKVLLGVGGACAACCALPIAGWFAGLGALAAGGWALSLNSVLLAAAVVMALALGAAALLSWRRQAARQAAGDNATACTLKPPANQCGCQPGSGCA
jgi:type VI protein secretion system component VasK